MPEAPRRRGRPRRDPDRLPPRMHQALVMFLAGAKYADIANALNVEVGTVRNWFADERMRRALDRELYAVKELVAAMLMGHAPDAARVLLEGLYAERYSDRLRAAEGILDRAGIKPGGPQLTVVELPQVVEVVIQETSSQGEASHRCYACDEGYRQRYWWQHVMRRALAAEEVGEGPPPGPRLELLS